MDAGILILPLMFVGLYLLMIRPQQKKMQAHRKLLSELRVGDVVVTSAGIYGAIAEIEDTVVWLEVAPDVELKVAKASVAELAPEVEDDDVEDDELEAADASDDEG
jgi:preprotein translocase subunit YajC